MKTTRKTKKNKSARRASSASAKQDRLTERLENALTMLRERKKTKTDRGAKKIARIELKKKLDARIVKIKERAEKKTAKHAAKIDKLKTELKAVKATLKSLRKNTKKLLGMLNLGITSQNVRNENDVASSNVQGNESKPTT